jgi:hypothetical protein
VKNNPFPPSFGFGQTMATRTTIISANGMNLALLAPLDVLRPWRDHLNKDGENVHRITFSVPK